MSLIERIDRNRIHPPPGIEEVLNFFKLKSMRRKCNAYKILRYSVGKECKRIGESNAILIGRVTNHLWNTSTSQEKSEYINLGQINSFTFDSNKDEMCGNCIGFYQITRMITIIIIEVGFLINHSQTLKREADLLRQEIMTRAGQSYQIMEIMGINESTEIIELRRRIMRLELKILKLKPRVEEHEVKFTNLEQRDKEKTNPVAKLDDDIKEIKKAYSEKES
ncbi:hypothetical protein Glove_374g54 [Diversispora epigaea]|uniref:Uncharacterized protein n=1 Tax=Diversispora epigaea TaxID=1348612 RepID=A0A397H5H8_9GLOM|nr:hypothetical protein Glove_374g54 [Diversispora epigaea]